MSKYTDLAMERRNQFNPDGKPAWNCCQAVVSVFTQDAGYDEDACMKAATYFRGGMQMGSVCGAVTGSLLALGLAGVDDPQASNEIIRKVRENHKGLIECKDLLRVNAENKGEKMQHCNAMIRECIGYVEGILRESGKIKCFVSTDNGRKMLHPS
ncbi:MAG: C_GCAxxG_C_C family protein [Clostridia bacterium]|nr:C_GCAxxG_C_C family protein [Clostridia bacterium]